MVAIKKLSIITALIFFALAATVTPAQAQCIEAATLTTTDVAIAAKLNDIKNFQSAYLITNNRYYQALWTHNATPDGTLKNVDNLLSRPSYQPETLQKIFDDTKMPMTLPMRFRVDWYDGPRGKGYVVVFEVVSCGKTMMRSINVGSEVYREQSWSEVKLKPVSVK